MTPQSAFTNSIGSPGAGLTIVAAVAILALPSGVLAFATNFDLERSAPGDSAEFSALRSDNAGPSLARGRSLLLDAPGGANYPFTPARNPNRPDRLVTVAVRLDSQALKAVSAYTTREEGPAASSNLRLAQSAFSLGVSRGYRTFAQEITSSATVHRSDSPDLSRFSIAPSAKRDDPGDAPPTLFDDKTNAGRAPRTFAADKDERVDLGGALKVTRNLDVTAGVRYTQDRERLLPLTDGKRDNQAVYVGTQLKF